MQGQLLFGFWLAGLGVISFWTVNAQAFQWQQGLGLVLLALAGCIAWIGWKNSPVGQLSWDGQAWHWESRGYPSGAAQHTVSVAFDCQTLMLLRIDNPAHARLWLWAERHVFPGRWLDLRRAVHSPHRAAGNEGKTA